MTAQQLFEKYNRKYFGGRLSGYVVIVSDRFSSHGLCRKKQRKIYLAEGLKGLERRRTLFHEMAHAAARAGHGAAWVKEMKRLHKLGAPTMHDIKEYESIKISNDKGIISLAEEHGMEFGDAWSWRTYKLSECYRKGLCDKCGRAVTPRDAKLLRKIRVAFLKGKGTVERALMVQRHDPELFQKIKDGESL